ncbi:MAG: hypothetical protein J5844_02055 [Clostridia bacterium]|nr:hypothetical protein [Clostridia bacterium]
MANVIIIVFLVIAVCASVFYVVRHKGCSCGCSNCAKNCKSRKKTDN